MDFKEKLEEELKKDMVISFFMWLGRGKKPLCPYCHRPILNPSVRSRTCGKSECMKKHKNRHSKLKSGGYKNE